MAYRVEVTRRFEKDFRRLPRDVQLRTDSAVKSLESDPFLGKRLRGEFEGTYSMRLGDYRMLYQLTPSEKRLILLTIAQTQSLRLEHLEFPVHRCA